MSLGNKLGNRLGVYLFGHPSTTRQKSKRQLSGRSHALHPITTTQNPKFETAALPTTSVYKPLEHLTHRNTSNLDIERLQKTKEYLEGFADFSRYIISDDALLIYRRSGAVGTRNILYSQAELHCLEQELEEVPQ